MDQTYDVVRVTSPGELARVKAITVQARSPYTAALKVAEQAGDDRRLDPGATVNEFRSLFTSRTAERIPVCYEVQLVL